jgi:tape measure domain-containing protein
MPDIVDATVRIRAQTAGFKGETDRAFGGLRTQLQKTKSSFQSLGEGVRNVGQKIRHAVHENMMGLMGLAMSTGMVSMAMTSLGKSVIGAAVQMDSLQRGLAAVSGGAEAAAAQMDQLREIAKLPGLGLQEAIEGATRLQAVGMSAESANRALMAFGNALARVGKGKAELSGVILALTQIIGKGKVMAQEINQIAERVPEVRKVMMEAFGTASTEEIQKMNLTAEEFIKTLTAGFEKMPLVTTGAQNAIENFRDAVFEMKVAIGNALLPTITEKLDIMSKFITQHIEQLSETQKSIIAWAGVSATAIASVTSAMATLTLAMPGIIFAIESLGGALTFLATSPLGAAILAVGGLAMAIFWLNRRLTGSKQPLDDFEQKLARISRMAKDSAKAVREIAKAEVEQSISELNKQATPILSRLADIRELRDKLLKQPSGKALFMLTPEFVEQRRLEKQLSEIESKIGGLRAIKFPVSPKEVDAKQVISNIEATQSKIRDILAETESVKASMMNEGLQKELATLKAEHDATVANLDADIAAIRGKSKDEIAEKQALLDLKEALEEKYQQDIQAIREKYAREEEKRRLDAAAKERDEIQRRINLVIDARQKQIDSLKATQAEQAQLTADFAKQARERQRLNDITLAQGQARIALIQDEATREKAEAWLTYKQQADAIQRRLDDEKTSNAERLSLEQTLSDLKEGLLKEFDAIDEKYAEKRKERAQAVADAELEAQREVTSALKKEQEKRLRSIEKIAKSGSETWEKIQKQGEQISAGLAKKPTVYKVKVDWGKDFEASSDELRRIAEDFGRDVRAEFESVKSAGIAAFADLAEAFADWVDEGKDEMSELSFAIRLMTQAATLDFIGMIGTLKRYFDPLIDYFRGINRDVIDMTEDLSKTLSTSISNIVSTGIMEGLSSAEIGDKIEEFLRAEVIKRAVAALMADVPRIQEAIGAWSAAVAEAVAPEGPGFAEITAEEQKRIDIAAENLRQQATQHLGGALPSLLTQPTETPAALPRTTRKIRRGEIEQPVAVTPHRPPRQAGPAVQISAITGPTRDILVSLLKPLRNLNVLPALFARMVKSIDSMRDAFLGNVNGAPQRPNGTTGASDNIAIENININVDTTADIADIDALDRNLSRAARREKRLLGRRR